MKPLYYFLILAVVMSVKGIAFADDSQTPNLIISGTVTTASCSVDTESQNLNVPLGDTLTGNFVEVGDHSPAKTFAIALVGCDESVAGATITFKGTADSDNPDLLQITKATGSATGVAVEILDSKDESIPLGKTVATKALTAGENTLNYQLRYTSTLGTVMAGSANAVMYFDLAYQ